MKIYFIQDTHIYELTLAPNKIGYTPISSFDECLDALLKESQVGPTISRPVALLFTNFEDVPPNYHLWSKSKKNEFVVLSPNAQFIDVYGSGKAVALDRNRLQAISSPFLPGLRQYSQPSETKEGFVMTFPEAYEQPTLEIVCDQVYEKKILYIHLIRSVAPTHGTCCNTTPAEQFSSFTLLLKNVDLSKITAALHKNGALKVKLPFLESYKLKRASKMKD